MRRNIKVLIKGTQWKVKLLNKSKYEQLDGEQSCGVTIMPERVIAFHEDFIDLGIIRHELMHAHMSESNIDSANLNPLQVEEVAAEIIRNHYDDIGNIAEFIFKCFKK